MKNKIIVDSLSRKWKQRMKRLTSKKDRQAIKRKLDMGFYSAEKEKDQGRRASQDIS